MERPWSKPLRNRIIRALSNVAGVLADNGDPELEAMARDAKDLLDRVAPQESTFKPLPGQSRAERALTRAREGREEWDDIKRQVLDRARGRCEHCFAWSVGLTVDHWLGGSGRRQAEQAPETCWALCAICNLERTNNHPTAADWNARFEEHCVKHGFTFTPHIEHNLKRQPRSET